MLQFFSLFFITLFFILLFCSHDEKKQPLCWVIRIGMKSSRKCSTSKIEEIWKLGTKACIRIEEKQIQSNGGVESVNCVCISECMAISMIYSNIFPLPHTFFIPLFCLPGNFVFFFPPSPCREKSTFSRWNFSIGKF